MCSYFHVFEALTNPIPQFLTQVLTEKRPLETVGINVLAKLFETVGLSVFLTYWGTRTNPFE
jgi:hypothetical protein